MPSWECCAALKPDGSPDHKLQLSTLNKENTNVTDNNISLLKNKLSLAIRKHINQYYQVRNIIIGIISPLILPFLLVILFGLLPESEIN